MDRFDLEQCITKTHDFVDILNDISYGILEVGMTNDEIANSIDGLAVMLKIHAEKMFDIFKQVHSLDEHSVDLSNRTPRWE